jgi:hypothetical protein
MFRHAVLFRIWQLFRVPNMGMASIPAPPDVANILLESGDDLLLETGGLMLLE